MGNVKWRIEYLKQAKLLDVTILNITWHIISPKGLIAS